MLLEANFHYKPPILLCWLKITQMFVGGTSEEAETS